MKIMAVDYGDVRTGLAVCDRTEFLASPIGVIEERNMTELVMKVLFMAEQYMVEEIIVGLPKNMDGTEGDRALKCRQFGDMLMNVTELPIKMWDERRTTITAHNVLNETNVRGKKRKAVVDEVAATIILESYLKFRENQKEKNS